ncbi:hypothetical protein GOODEAATRI_025185 [Goodea atripinnis]|uniref:Cadherin domain-containing protein n=1 Tax=Goodea atripinnis TaxID=208336 RepID=A0ABV0PH88_9TELE
MLREGYKEMVGSNTNRNYVVIKIAQEYGTECRIDQSYIGQFHILWVVVQPLAWLMCTFMSLLPGMWSFSVSELAIPGAEIGHISATDADLGENAKLEYTILEGETGDTFNITGVNQEAVITLNKVRDGEQKQMLG